MPHVFKSVLICILQSTFDNSRICFLFFFFQNLFSFGGVCVENRLFLLLFLELSPAMWSHMHVIHCVLLIVLEKTSDVVLP